MVYLFIENQDVDRNISVTYDDRPVKVMRQYSTDLTHKQWKVIKKILNLQEKRRKNQLPENFRRLTIDVKGFNDDKLIGQNPGC